MTSKNSLINIQTFTSIFFVRVYVEIYLCRRTLNHIMLHEYFEKYGHKCSLDLNKPLHKFFVNKSKFRKWYMRHAVICQDLILMRSPPRSHASLRNEIIYHLENFPWALHPFSNIMWYLDIVWMVVIFFWLVISPFDIVAQLNFSETCYAIVYFETGLATVCLLDCIPRFLQGYYIKHCDSDEIVLDSKRTAWLYFKTYFWIDFISAMAVFVRLALTTHIKYHLLLRLVSILRIFRVGTMVRVMMTVMKYFRFSHHVIDIFCGITILCLIVHIVACFSVLPGIIARRFSPTAYVWYDDIIPEDARLFDKYMVCLHRTLSILQGAGYSLFLHEKKSISDMIYTIFTSILGHILLMSVFAKVYEIVSGLRSSLAKYEEMLSEISNYMSHQKLSKSTQDKIKTYYAYKYEYSYFNEHKLLVTIPVSLRESILMNSSKLLLENIEFFKKLPVSVASNILTYLEKEILLPGDVVYRSGETGYTVYFLLTGAVASFTYSGRELAHFEDGSEFGERAFPNDRKPHRLTIVVVETTEVFKLSVEDFASLLDYCPDMVEQIEKLTITRSHFAEFIEERFTVLRNKAILLQNQEDDNNRHGRNPSLI